MHINLGNLSLVVNIEITLMDHCYQCQVKGPVYMRTVDWVSLADVLVLLGYSYLSSHYACLDNWLVACILKKVDVLFAKALKTPLQCTR